MKRHLSFLLVLVLGLLLLVPVNSAFAEGEDDEHCGCDVTMITGAERNKMVSNLLKTGEFKDIKNQLIHSGYKWQGAGAVEVLRIRQEDGNIIEMAGAKFFNSQGKTEVAGFVLANGLFIYQEIVPYE